MALSLTHEKNRQPRWDGEFNSSMLSAIVGIDIQIESIQCKYKLSQNRPIEDRKNVIAELDKAGNTRLAEAMRKQLNNTN